VSPTDTMEVELTERWVQDVPAVSPVTNTTMASSPGSEIVEETPQDGGMTGFGLFADVLTEVLPYALEMLAL